jgi:hypothetical protein
MGWVHKETAVRQNAATFNKAVEKWDFLEKHDHGLK